MSNVKKCLLQLKNPNIIYFIDLLYKNKLYNFNMMPHKGSGLLAHPLTTSCYFAKKKSCFLFVKLSWQGLFLKKCLQYNANICRSECSLTSFNFYFTKLSWLEDIVLGLRQLFHVKQLNCFSLVNFFRNYQ